MHGNGRSQSGHDRKRDSRRRAATAPVPHSDCADATDEPHGLTRLLLQLAELREYSAYYVSAKVDEAKLSVRRFAAAVVLAILGFFAALGLIVVAVWLVIVGAAEGVGLLLGNRPWAGNVVIGLLTLFGLGAGAAYGTHVWMKVARSKTEKRYEQRKHEQVARFGRNVSKQAAARSE